MGVTKHVHCPSCGERIIIAPRWFAERVADMDAVAPYISDPNGDGAYTQLLRVQGALAGDYFDADAAHA